MTARWYVRGTNESHEYDRSAVVSEARPGESFCSTCVVVHHDPVGSDWHIESYDVDTMLCGLRIELDDGAVKVKPTRNVCSRCRQVAEREEDAR